MPDTQMLSIVSEEKFDKVTPAAWGMCCLYNSKTNSEYNFHSSFFQKSKNPLRVSVVQQKLVLT